LDRGIWARRLPPFGVGQSSLSPSPSCVSASFAHAEVDLQNQPTARRTTLIQAIWALLKLLFELLDYPLVAVAAWRYPFAPQYRREVHTGWRGEPWYYVAWDVLWGDPFGSALRAGAVWIALPMPGQKRCSIAGGGCDGGDGAMNDFERRVRAAIMTSFRETSQAPSVEVLAVRLGASPLAVSAALHALAAEHALVLQPGSDAIWMAHPFSGIDTDFLVTIAGRHWFANCAWDGLSILALLGDGELETHSPATGELLRYSMVAGNVHGAGLIHFLVPARRFWDDIGFT